MQTSIDTIVEALVARYRSRIDWVQTLEDGLIRDGIIAHRGQLVNDHIALRTLGTLHLGIGSLEPLFVYHGYEPRDAYHFAGKHLDARWFEPPSDRLPRIFISELRVCDLPAAAAARVVAYTNAVERPPLAGIDPDDALHVVAALEAQIWPAITHDDYAALLAQSEYAAWTLVNGYALNHLTLSVHELRADMQSIVEFNRYLESCGIRLNAAGGKVKVSPDGLLVQSSTIAQSVEHTFAGGDSARVAGPYIEFAERRVLPQFMHLPPASVRREHRRNGFEAANADRIFESTHVMATPDIMKD